MRFFVSVAAVVVVLAVIGAFYSGYRIGELEGERAAVAQGRSAAAGAQTAAAEDGPQDDADAVRRVFADASQQQASAISGEITLGQALAKEIKHPYQFTKDDTLFVIATKPESGPQPIAVVRINDLAGKTWPIKYEIGPGDLMIQDQGSFSGPLNIKVKLSHSGDARTTPGDFLGYPHGDGGVAPGAKGVELELREIAKAKPETSSGAAQSYY